MRTVQMTLEDDLVREVDVVSRNLKTSRSAFAREALREALVRYRVAREEERHRRGYERHPVGTREFSAWEDEHAWGDA